MAKLTTYFITAGLLGVMAADGTKSELGPGAKLTLTAEEKDDLPEGVEVETEAARAKRIKATPMTHQRKADELAKAPAKLKQDVARLEGELAGAEAEIDILTKERDTAQRAEIRAQGILDLLKADHADAVAKAEKTFDDAAAEQAEKDADNKGNGA